METLQVHAITEDNDSIQGEPGFRTIPGDEIVHGVLVGGARLERAEGVQN
jgi:hypothetical protein